MPSTGSTGGDAEAGADAGNPFSSQLPPTEGLTAFATVHETIDLVLETEGASVPAVAAKGKWHGSLGAVGSW